MWSFVSTVRAVIRRGWESQAAQGSLPLLTSNIVVILVSFGKSVLLARAFGSVVYGVITYSIALATFAAQFLRFNTADTVIRFVGSAVAREQPKRAWPYLLVSVALETATAVITLLAIKLFILPAAAAHAQSDLLQPMVSIYALAVPVTLIKIPFTAAMMTIKRFGVAAILQFLSAMIDLTAVLLGVPSGPLSLMKYIASAAILGSTLTILVSAWFFKQEIGAWSGEGYRKAWEDIKPFAFSGGVQATLKSLTKNLDVVVLGALRPASEVAYYTLARGAVGVLGTIAAPVLQVFQPLINEAWFKDQFARMRSLILNFMLVNAGLAISAAGVLFLFGEWLVVRFYGAQFEATAGLMQLLIIATGLEIVFAWMRKLLLIAGYPKLDLLASAIGTFSFLILLVPFISIWGSTGLSVLIMINVLVMITIFGWFGATRFKLSPAHITNHERA